MCVLRRVPEGVEDAIEDEKSERGHGENIESSMPKRFS